MPPFPRPDENSEGRLTAETAAPGSWTLSLSDGSERTVATAQEPRALAIDSPWKTVETRDGGFTLVGLERASDQELWLYARENDLTIVSKDSDFT